MDIINQKKEKFCTKCKKLKLIEDFCFCKTSKDKLSYKCKECRTEEGRNYRKKHRNTHIEYRRNYLNKNREKINKYTAEYRKTESGKIAFKKCYEKRKLLGKPYSYEKNKIKNDPNFKLTKRLRQRIKRALDGIGKISTSEKLLGCSFSFFINYIEILFKEGMSFDNYGKIWDLDHYIPCNYFNLELEEEQKICFHYKNLRPLFCYENRCIKNSKIPEDTNEKILEIKKLINDNSGNIIYT